MPLARIARFALAPLLLAGCVERPDASAPSLNEALAATPAMTWAAGDWWAFHATVGNRSFDVALVVAENRPDGFLVGTNRTGGFFGLPFHGNVTRELNPTVGADEWPLYRFPLADGKSWRYMLSGHDAAGAASAAMVDVPGVGPQPGFQLEASAYGQPFAHYDYSPTTGWFTALELFDPATGATVLQARLFDFGNDYGEAYFVERGIREIRVPYPALPGRLPLDLPAALGPAEAVLVAQAQMGVVTARLVDEAGRMVASVRALGLGSDSETTEVLGGRSWWLDHSGAGKGLVLLRVNVAQQEGGGGPQTAFPFVPHTGQVISTG